MKRLLLIFGIILIPLMVYGAESQYTWDNIGGTGAIIMGLLFLLREALGTIKRSRGFPAGCIEHPVITEKLTNLAVQIDTYERRLCGKIDNLERKLDSLHEKLCNDHDALIRNTAHQGDLECKLQDLKSRMDKLSS